MTQEEKFQQELMEIKTDVPSPGSIKLFTFFFAGEWLNPMARK